MVLRFVAPDGSSEIIALDGAPANFKLGLRAPGSGDGSVHRVWRTRRATRIDDLGAMSGQWPRMASRYGFSTSAGVPILLHGEMWGALIVAGREPMPPSIESHLADFAELVSTAISAAQARAELRVLADEQAALRRVATLVANEAPREEVFNAIAAGIGTLLEAEEIRMLRYEGGDSVVEEAGWGRNPSLLTLGVRHSLKGDGVTARVLRTGKPARMDDFDGAPGEMAAIARANRLRSAVGIPILVDGRVWGLRQLGDGEIRAGRDGDRPRRATSAGPANDRRARCAGAGLRDRGRAPERCGGAVRRR